MIATLSFDSAARQNRPAARAAAPASDDARYEAVLRRDRAFDGVFITAVRTTGIYCRPSCPARHPLRQNVSFYASPAEAEDAGFRACKRCKPKDALPPGASVVAEACRLIEQAETPPDLASLAASANLSPAHFHRLFKAETGLTPRAYAAAKKGARVRDALSDGARVTDAIYAAGYNSSGRFYADADAMLGMTPGRFRSGGAGEAIRYATRPCSLGHVLVAATDMGVCAVTLGSDDKALAAEFRGRFPNAEVSPGDATFTQWVDAIVAMVETPARGADLPLDIRGTAFQQRVWQALRAIPMGETRSYAEVARTLGMPSASRAVASACAKNDIALAIPCHRVVRSDGSISGYRWGPDIKRDLLAREKRAAKKD